ncbi:baseplate J/gp47 family protein [Pseudomonas huaxiensis]|uniref:baseplate J/gp47 family protein n=1 Tax=Pseudomonas huaxiensis TaxID=2213017 RepID=UPI000DA6BABF|nr:baseplate J/gp47 family protein [Pseudomonas huaxiensis]
MPFHPPAYESIRDGILRDIRSLLPDADIGSDSDNFIRSAAVSAAIEGLYQHQAWLYRQIFPDTADEAELLHHAGTRNIRQRAAVAATGVVQITGTSGVPLIAGSTLKHVASGALMVVTEAATIGEAGTVTVSAIAQSVGVGMNGMAGSAMLTSPPLGIDAIATITEAFTGGSNIESPASVLARLLDLLRTPPAGGAEYDYKRWALEVDGVASAKVLAKRRGPNTVDVVITGESGAPSDEVIAACEAYIGYMRPVTAEVFVYPPLIRTVTATANVELASGYKFDDVQKAAQVAYNEELGALAPDELLRRNRIGTILGNIAGVTDYEVLTPTENVPATDVAGVIGWIRPGTITLGLMS